MNSNLKQAIEYIIFEVDGKGDSLDFTKLDGRKFNPHNIRFEAIHYLESNGLISKVINSVGQTYLITTKGKEYIFKIFFEKVLEYLATNDSAFHLVETILKELNFPDQSNDLAFLIRKKLIKEELVFNTEEGRVMINENGKEMLIAKRFGISQEPSKSQSEGNDFVEKSDFTTQEREELNSKIDSILDDLKKLKLGQEIIWTDVKEEMSELKNLYYLNKRNWRQLLTGKLTEMVAGGIVSETISKNIIEILNPALKNLPVK